MRYSLVLVVLLGACTDTGKVPAPEERYHEVCLNGYVYYTGASGALAPKHVTDVRVQMCEEDS